VDGAETEARARDDGDRRPWPGNVAERGPRAGRVDVARSAVVDALTATARDGGQEPQRSGAWPRARSLLSASTSEFSNRLA
jgi:hypothetical protein